jgi:two-component system, chemotaxis family, chemotaxis protein CheY
MINLDDELAGEYLAECREHLATVEAGLLSMEKSGAQIGGELVNGIFRAVHSVKGGAGFFDLVKIRELAHQTEDVLARVRNGKMVPTPDHVRVLLRAADKLRELIEYPDTSNKADIGEIMAALAGLCVDVRPPADSGRQDGVRLRMLLVEDDFTSRLLLQTFLSHYGECHIAVNGKEAVDAFRSSLEHGQRYDLICMDIMMPEMNGREAVRRVRALEEEHGIVSTSGAKIIMTTAMDDIKEVIRCFKELCDAYLIKPIDLAKLLGHMKSFQLVQ